ncbi:hypothetical protein FHX44_115962 [Pseudonocardia hierapolitana]|uniref:Type II CBASS E2 protein domain-containing protein n=1 Tax=Pseudonocardia hierapolitana TaxID=1128676 RepID=A0A561SYS0_9PSEU|nr:hypothetical protein [Pseudonocardia hierapolitana]TWF80025.1 hypothetical protein FHX44_115962 [Pseudonocardia hierapolitana]
MTLPSLLRRVGLDVPRGVSIDGRILTGRAATAAIASGAATSVERHTFHGGDDPPTLHIRNAWWQDPAARRTDISAVGHAFPHFQLDDSDGAHNWRGTIDTGRGRFVIHVVGDPGGGLPHVVPVLPRALGRHEGRRGFRRAEHLYASGNLCVADISDWDPDLHTSATAIAWAAHWLAAYTDWCLGGPWPTDGYQPRAAA